MVSIRHDYIHSVFARYAVYNRRSYDVGTMIATTKIDRVHTVQYYK